MTFSAAPRSTPLVRSSIFASALILFAALCLAPRPALAQHGAGAGHSSGGVHSGGSGHVAAPSGSGSSHFSGTKSVASSYASHPAIKNPSGAAYSTASGAGGGFSSRESSSPESASSTIAHGNSFAAGSAFSAPRNVTIGFPPRAAAEISRAPLERGSHINFFGDGNEVWQEPSRGQTAQAFSQQQSARRGSGNAPQASALPNVAPVVARVVARVVAPVRVPIVSAATPPAGAMPRHFTQNGAASPTPLFTAAPGRDAPRFGAPVAAAHIFPRPPHRPVFGGFGGNGFTNRGFDPWFFGFGWGLNAWNACDPTWAFGCNSFADRYSGYDWDASQSSLPVDDSIGDQPAEDVVPSIWQAPPAPPDASDEIAAEKSLVVLFLNDGSVYALTNYWVEGGKLHYKTSYGAENSLDLGELDLQRTVNANAARGVEFTLRPAPGSLPPAAPPPVAAPQIQPQQ